MRANALWVCSMLLVSCGGDDPSAAGAPDSSPLDTGSVEADGDASIVDSGSPDSGSPDGEALDAGTDGATDSGAADGGSTDASVADTFVADTFVADTFVADTFVADTFVADTFVADTFVADTLVADSADAGASRPHIVGPSVGTYVEAAETTNGNRAGAESTGVSMTPTGTIFAGAYEATSPTVDCYRFSTGSSTRVDVQAFFGTTGLTGTPGLIYLSLGDCSLTTSTFGLDYLVRSVVTPSTDYCLCATPRTGAAGNAYTLEVRTSP